MSEDEYDDLDYQSCIGYRCDGEAGRLHLLSTLQPEDNAEIHQIGKITDMLSSSGQSASGGEQLS